MPLALKTLQEVSMELGIPEAELKALVQMQKIRGMMKRGKLVFAPDEIAKINKQVDDANHQGEMLARKMAGKGKGGRDIFGLAKERTTDWRSALQDFISAICAGDDQSRFSPPNKRLLASGFIMPSHFTESVGDIIIAADTSGSMYPHYRLLFGEVARICQLVKPDSVRVIWWDNDVCSEQLFKPSDYEQLGVVLKPQGGGGTTPECVTQYMADKRIDEIGRAHV